MIAHRDGLIKGEHCVRCYACLLLWGDENSGPFFLGLVVGMCTLDLGVRAI